MMNATSLFLLAAAAIGTFLLVVQLASVVRHVRSHARRAPRPLSSQPPGISILKPLCGVDDGLETNLESFARLGYPRYEVVLGVKNKQDPAYEVARAAVARWPKIMRLEVQRGEPGLNPKVNQLITLSAAARYDLLLISDSNMRAAPGYLEGIAQAFEDPDVACVTHPVVGIGEQTLGSLMDNLYLCTTAAAGQIASKRVAGKDIVVGKSMALRRADLEALGGFQAAKDVLAEDFIIGQWIAQRLRRRVALVDSLVCNVSQRRSVRAFWKRYTRWSIIHRTCIRLTTYLGQSLLNPLPWGVLGALLVPTQGRLQLLGALVAIKVAVDLTAFRLLRPGQRMPWGVVPALLLRDVLLFAAWVNALINRTVDWRGNRLQVLEGSRLAGPPPLDASEPLPPPEADTAEELMVG